MLVALSKILVSCHSGSAQGDVMMVEMKDALLESDKAQIFSTWNAVYPSQVSFGTEDEFNQFLAGVERPTHLIVRGSDSEILGWLMSFDRQGTRSFVMLVADSMQQKGVGRALLEQMMDMETEVAAWAVASSSYRRLDGAPYHSPLGFYRRFGFSILDEKMTKGDFETTKIAWRKTP